MGRRQRQMGIRDRGTGADGKPKDSYRNQTEAQRRADILRKEQGAELRVYACEHKHGWHLTKGHGR